MANLSAKIFVAAAVGLCLVAPLGANDARAARFSGGHFSGGGHFGGFQAGGAHFGSFHAGHFGGLRMGHVGGAHFAHFGGHLGARHFGHVGHFTTAHVGAAHIGRAYSGRGRFARFAGTHFRGRTANLGHGARAFAGHNGFGNRHGWNAWYRGGYGYGWGYGWAGPVFWPYFYGDLLSFALWPDEYYDPFFAFGPDDLFASIFWPDTYPYGWSENPYDIYAYATTPEPGQGQALADQTCAALAPGITDLPIERIERAIKPDDTQTAILGELQTASAKADDVLRNSCPSQPPLTPVSRLEAAGKRIDALLQAVQIIRAPLTTFVNSLDDTQRERFNAIAFGAPYRRRHAPANALGNLCSDQAKNFANLPVSDIETTVKPTGEEQTAALTALKNASAKAAAGMESSCPSTAPATLTDRLDVITKRLDAMAGAVKTIEPPLQDFYASLNDEQKAEFNVMAPPAPGASQTQSR
jgi:LTXXQ motif family protein